MPQRIGVKQLGLPGYASLCRPDNHRYPGIYYPTMCNKGPGSPATAGQLLYVSHVSGTR